MIFSLTFELWDLSCCALGQPFVAGVAGQRHGHATAAQEEADLLTACILLDDKQRERGRGGEGGRLTQRFTSKVKTLSLKRSCRKTWRRFVSLHRSSSGVCCTAAAPIPPPSETLYGKSCSRHSGRPKGIFCCSSNHRETMTTLRSRRRKDTSDRGSRARRECKVIRAAAFCVFRNLS